MVTKRIRSEYMKRFKDPKWETYTKCYEDMLKYRLTRRLLEHTHNPWFWSGSDTDSDSGGRSPPAPSKNQVRAETGRDRAETGRDRAETGRDRAEAGRDRAEAGRDRAEAELEECEGARVDRRAGLPLQEKKEEEEEEEEGVSAPQPAVHGSHEGTRETRVPEEESEEQAARSRGSRQLAVPPREQDRERDTGAPQRSKPSKSRQTWRSQRVRPAPTQQPGEGSKESRHPFALYGSGEKDADIAGRKTHNVGPAASTNEIHESALRAKTRREVERQIQTQRTERRRAKSADQDKARKLVQPEFNPWLTEYMRCFSARSR